MSEKCPYCYRNFGTWLKDPILLPTGAEYAWDSDTELVIVPDIEDRIHKGIYQITESEVKELQDSLTALETENGVSPLTIFSPLTSDGIFQITGQHIKEMRDSVEGILAVIGMTKTDFFNYDEEGNHIIHPNGDKTDWTDPITSAEELTQFQIKYIHIEELRHYVSSLWQETWEDTRIEGGDPLSKITDTINRPNPPGMNDPPVYFPVAHLYADNMWSTIFMAFALSISGSGNKSALGTCTWASADSVFSCLGEMTELKSSQNLNVYGQISGNLISYSFSPYKSITINTRLQIDNWNSSITYSEGTHVILDPAYTEALNSSILAGEMGGESFVVVYFNNGNYIKFRKRQSQNYSSSYSLDWVGSNMNLYDGYISLYGYVAPAIFNTWTITKIIIGTEIKLRTFSIAIEDMWGIKTVVAYTTNASCNIDMSIDNLKLFN